jgi:hypothetical protein
MLRWLWSSLLRVIARNRAVTLALLSAVASVLMGLAVTWHDTSSTGGGVPVLPLVGFAIAVLLIVLAGAVPAEYEAATRLEWLLQVMHDVLGLGPSERLTVHRLHSFPVRGYEQLTEYHPRPPRKHTQGRTFPLSHGIVAQCFNHPGHPTAWAVPAGQSFEEAMMARWLFNEEEARRLTSDRRSFLAYPIGQEGAYASAVLYADSPDPARFDGAAGDAAIARIRELFEGPLTNALKG